MQQQTITVSPSVELQLEKLSGNLRVAGWERAEVMAKTDGDELNLSASNNHVTVSCDENLILYMPRSAGLRVRKVAGDASLQALAGSVDLEQVAGDLTLNDIARAAVGTVAGDVSLRNSGALQLESVSGNLVLRHGKGDITATSVGGDASLRDVHGKVEIKHVGSDFYLRNARGPVNVTAGADAALYLEPQPGVDYQVKAGDDLLLRLPPEASVELQLTSSEPHNIHIDFPDVTIDEEATSQVVTLGGGAARMYLEAADNIVVTSRAERWQTVEEFGFGMGDFEFPRIPEIPPLPHLPPDFNERINRRVTLAMEKAQRHAEAAGKRAEIKVEAALRRAEAKARAAEQRARRANVNLKIGRWDWDLTPGKFTPTGGHPVSDEERLTILRMLQEKKISLDEAEKLLSALEGKGVTP
ncbi:MAG: hypothetical protein FJZ96_03185 [Chloroflexi bacterium]|nr:hypothetical protein [Chloroflexota bacterium]